MTPKDQRLERSIEIASLAFHCAQDPKERRATLEHLRSLIAQRSPERVRELEERKAGKG